MTTEYQGPAFSTKTLFSNAHLSSYPPLQESKPGYHKAYVIIPWGGRPPHKEGYMYLAHCKESDGKLSRKRIINLMLWDSDSGKK